VSAPYKLPRHEVVEHVEAYRRASRLLRQKRVTALSPDKVTLHEHTLHDSFQRLNRFGHARIADLLAQWHGTLHSAAPSNSLAGKEERIWARSLASQISRMVQAL
jgi:hypothetical protein